jgi:hypothetical protein
MLFRGIAQRAQHGGWNAIIRAPTLQLLFPLLFESFEIAQIRSPGCPCSTGLFVRDPSKDVGRSRQWRKSERWNQLSEFAKVAAVDSRSKTAQKVWFLKVTEIAETVANPLRRLVELVGIEPTTSSLRTMRSPS